MTELEKKMLQERKNNALGTGEEVGADTNEFVDFAANAPQMPVPAAPIPELVEEIPPPTSVGNTEVRMNGELSSADLAQFGAAAGPAEPEPEPEPEKEEVDEDITGLELHQCPKCGWNLDNSPEPEVTDEDKNEFIRSILGERRFCKEYEFFDGRVKVNLRSPLRGETAGILVILQEDVAEHTIQTPEEWQLRNRELSLSTALVSVKVEDKLHTFEEIAVGLNSEKLRAALQEAAGRRAAWPESITSMVIYAQAQFESTHTTLLARTYDSDFWVGLTDSNR